MKNNVTILINSCDKYQDAWDPFIRLFKEYWPDCPYDMVINTETIECFSESDRVRTICSDTKELTWSQRFKYCLDQIDTEYVLFCLEDYFVQKPVNTEVFYKALNLMESNKKIGMAALSYGRNDVKTGEYEDDCFFSRIIDEKNMIWCRMNLYRKDYLMSLIRVHESIWEFESYASYRAKKLPYIILQQNNNYEECFTFHVKIEEGYGITEGKWLPKNLELFSAHNIDVDISKLGMYESNGKADTSIKKNWIFESLYKVKHEIKVIKRTVKKKINKIRSTH